MSDDPFAPPVTNDEVAGDQSANNLAGRFTRLAAVIVDSILMMAIVVPVYFMTGFMQRAATGEVTFLEQMATSAGWMVVMLVLNGYLLVSRGQTIGKMLTGIQIVDYDTEQLLPFVRVYVYRYLWTLPLLIVVALIPGMMDDNLVNVATLIDALFIFGTYRRCLHDHFAGSKVVLYQPNRAKLD